MFTTSKHKNHITGAPIYVVSDGKTVIGIEPTAEQARVLVELLTACQE